MQFYGALHFQFCFSPLLSFLCFGTAFLVVVTGEQQGEKQPFKHQGKEKSEYIFLK